MSTSRQRILEFLQNHPRATILELSQACGQTRANVRYHLSALQKEGRVEKIHVPGGGRGRPDNHYQLTPQSQPHNLAQLVNILFDQILTNTVPGNVNALLRQIARQMPGEVAPAQHLTQRLNRAITYLNGHNYQARWEAHHPSPQIQLRNCPYAAIIAAHPMICQVDQYLLERLANATVQPVCWYTPQTGIPSVCIFTIKP